MIPERIKSLVLTSTTAGNTNEVAPVGLLKRLKVTPWILTANNLRYLH